MKGEKEVGLRQDLENEIFIRVWPKDDSMDHRTSLCGEAMLFDDDGSVVGQGKGKKYFEVPAHAVNSAKALGYTIGEEFRVVYEDEDETAPELQPDEVEEVPAVPVKTKKRRVVHRRKKRITIKKAAPDSALPNNTEAVDAAS